MAWSLTARGLTRRPLTRLAEAGGESVRSGAPVKITRLGAFAVSAMRWANTGGTDPEWWSHRLKGKREPSSEATEDASAVA